jgi:hypothetical protein
MGCKVAFDNAWLSGFIDAEGCFMLTAEIEISMK